jgi:hypothetical protein
VELTEEVDEKRFLSKRLLSFTADFVNPEGNERSELVVKFNITWK